MTDNTRSVSQSFGESRYLSTKDCSLFSECFVNVDSPSDGVKLSAIARTFSEHSRPRCMHRLHIWPGHPLLLGSHSAMRPVSRRQSLSYLKPPLLFGGDDFGEPCPSKCWDRSMIGVGMLTMDSSRSCRGHSFIRRSEPRIRMSSNSLV